jgi:uncharacterized protein (TIGR02246 family)
MVLAVGLAAVVAAGGLFKATRLQADGAEPKAGEQEGLDKGRRAEYIAAYNRGDAKAVAAFWAEDATYIDEDGHEYKGRAAIEKLYKKAFEARKGAKLAIHPTAIKQLSPDVALEEGITEVTPPDGGPVDADRFSAVLVRKGGQWYLQSVHDSEAPPPSNNEHLDDLAWLIGEWAGEAERGESATATYEWADGESFIVSNFATTVDGKPVIGGTQWIGWDAIDKQIRSWSFYSRGGSGEATWTKDGNKWLLKTSARTADGKKVSATNVITKMDDDHMTWQMTKLTVDGQSLPDLQPVKMKRVKEAQP